MTNSKTPQKVRKALQLYFDAVLLIQSFEGSPLRYWLYQILVWWLNLHSFRLRDCGDDGRLSQKRNFPSYCSAAQKSQMKVEDSGNLCFPISFILRQFMRKHFCPANMLNLAVNRHFRLSKYNKVSVYGLPWRKQWANENKVPYWFWGILRLVRIEVEKGLLGNFR